jgi:hypothetical protein
MIFDARSVSRKAREEGRLLARRIAAADHRHGHVAVEGAVAGGARRQPVADELLFIRQPEPLRTRAARDDEGARLLPLPVHLQAQMSVRLLEVLDRLIGKTRPEALRLRLHVHDQFRPVDALREAGKVLHQRGRRELPARLVPFEDERREIRPRRVDRSREASAAGSDDDDFFHRMRGGE